MQTNQSNKFYRPDVVRSFEGVRKTIFIIDCLSINFTRAIDDLYQDRELYVTEDMSNNWQTLDLNVTLTDVESKLTMELLLSSPVETCFILYILGKKSQII